MNEQLLNSFRWFIVYDNFLRLWSCNVDSFTNPNAYDYELIKYFTFARPIEELRLFKYVKKDEKRNAPIVRVEVKRVKVENDQQAVINLEDELKLAI